MGLKINKPIKTQKMSNKDVCGGCMKEFTSKTLARYGGTCFKCSHPKEAGSGGTTTVAAEKVECPQCKKEYTNRTLKKNGGICGHCLKKNTDGDGSTKAPRKSVLQEKAPCPKCKKEFTLKTLEKYSGMCNRCYEKETARPVMSSAFTGIPASFPRSGLTIPGL